MHYRSYSFTLLALIIQAAQADQPPSLIDTNNPAKVTREVTRTQLTQPLNKPKVAPQTVTHSALTLDSQFTIKQIRFIGKTHYSMDLLLASYQDLIGQSVTLRTLLAATQKITERYQGDGYPLSFAYLPTNNFQNNVLQVNLVEGYVANVKLDSDNAAVSEQLMRLAQPMLNENPLQQKTFDRYSQLMSHIPDTTVTVSAPRPTNTNGATDLIIKSSHPRHWNVATAFDARDGEYTALLNATFSGFTSYGEQLALATMLPVDKDNKQSYLGLNYQQYLNDDDLQLQLKGSFYQKKPKKYTYLLSIPNTNIELDAKQKQTLYTAGMQLNYPLSLSTRNQWNMYGLIDYTDKKYQYNYQLKQNGNVINFPLESTTQTVKYPAAELGLSGLKIYDTAYWALRLNARQGLDGSVSGNNPLNSDLTFTRWKANLEGAYIINSRWRLSSSVEGGWSDDNLPESERITFGGLRYGRGYDDGEASGDYGYGAQFEVRYMYPIEASWLSSVQPYVVIDTANTRSNTSIYKAQKLASYALGTTLTDNQHYTLSVEGARPIGDKPSNSGQRDWRFNLTFSYNFNSIH